MPVRDVIVVTTYRVTASTHAVMVKLLGDLRRDVEEGRSIGGSCGVYGIDSSGSGGTFSVQPIAARIEQMQPVGLKEGGVGSRQST